MKHIIYIGTHLKTGNPTTTVVLSHLLRSIGWSVDCYGKSKHKILRFFQMCNGVLFHNSNFVLIDTYSTFNFYYALVCGFIAKIKGIPYILILHGGNLPKRLEKRKWYSDWLFNNAAKIVSPSGYLQSEVMALGFDVDVIPNPLNLQQYEFTSNRTKIPVLLWVRALQDIYNPLMAIEVLVELKKTYPKARLIMVGPDKDGTFKRVESLTRSCNIEGGVKITGGLPKQVWLELAKEADIFLNTSKVDNSPISVIEAMALGLPVISTNVGGMPYIIKNELNGVLVQTKEEMTLAVINLISNDKLYNTIVEGGKETAATYDSKKVAELWNDILTTC